MMMSKEREILRKIVDYMWEGELVDEIKELLAQPEQEPVAWMYEWYENDLESTQVTGGSEKPFEGEIVQPFNIRPLYTAPPTREPLSDKDVGKGFLLTDVWHRYESFIAGVKFAEKHHGIGGGE